MPHTTALVVWGRCRPSRDAVPQGAPADREEIAARLTDDPGYRAIQKIGGIGPVLAAVFVAEIGDVIRFLTPRQLSSWAGLTPRHRESDVKVVRGI
jgi:transposase